MSRSGLFSTVVAVAVVGSFAAGVMAPDLRAGGLPELFSNLRPGGAGRELDPVNTYSKVLQLVKDNYSGDKATPTDRLMTETAVRGMLASLDDPYTRYLNREEYRALREENTGEFEGIGAQLQGVPTPEGYVRISKPLPNGPADKAGIKKGDLITKIDGKAVPGLSVDDAVKLIRGKAGTQVHLTVLRKADNNKIHEIAITRAPVEYEVVEYKMTGGENGKPGDIGYISLAQFNEMADPKIEHAFRDMQAKGMKGVVLDLRGNPGGLLDAAIDVSSRFIPNGHGVVIIVESGGDREVRKTIGRKFMGGMPLVVLVNGTSASASEIVSGAIKDNKAGVILGKTTFGKGLVQTVVPLEDGSACMITTAKYLTPNGNDINRSRKQRGGVEPDVTVEETEDEFFKGKDTQLDKAVEILHDTIRNGKPLPIRGSGT